VSIWRESAVVVGMIRCAVVWADATKAAMTNPANTNLK
jgi:hypothetical protein